VERCRECAGRRLAFASAVSAVAYAGPARPFVRAWKEGGLRHLARPAAEVVVALVEHPSAHVVTAPVITHVPPDPVRQLRRSTHPAAGLARELARLWALEQRTLLGRARTADRQAALPSAGRRANVQGAFAALGPVSGEVLLVDDIYTTGATVSAAATALRAAGAARVVVVTFARATRR
jgi:competence protein ComFC